MEMAVRMGRVKERSTVVDEFEVEVVVDADRCRAEVGR
jgi:hypothetical protein